MLLDRYQRFLLRHEIQFKTARDRGLPLSLLADGDELDVLSLLGDAQGTEKGRHTLRNRDVVQLTKVDVRPQDEIAVLLFRRSDPDAAPPVYENMEDGTLRRVRKADNEALAVSAHLFISLRRTNPVYPTYRSAIEEVPGLGRTYVNYVIANILRNSHYEFIDHRGHPKQTYTTIDFHGIKSDSIGGTIDGSTVSYVELVRQARIDGLDTEGLVVPREERMRLKVRAQSPRMLAVLGRIRDWALARDWSDVRVRMDLPEDRSRVVSIAREADAADVLFVRSVAVRVPTAMDPCTDTINEELVAEAVRILGDENA